MKRSPDRTAPEDSTTSDGGKRRRESPPEDSATRPSSSEDKLDVPDDDASSSTTGADADKKDVGFIYMGVPLENLDQVKAAIEMGAFVRENMMPEEEKRELEKKESFLEDNEEWIKKLRLGAEYDDIEAIKKALEHVPVDSPTVGAMMCNTTALSFAVGCCSTEAVRYLLEHDADPNIVLGFRSPLHTVAQVTGPEIVDILEIMFNHGGDPRVKDVNDRTLAYHLKRARREYVEQCKEDFSDDDEDEEKFLIPGWWDDCLRMVREWTPARLGLPAWSTRTHRRYCEYGSGFGAAIKCWMLAAQRLGVPDYLATMIVEFLGVEERKSRAWPIHYEPEPEQELPEGEVPEDCILM